MRSAGGVLEGVRLLVFDADETLRRSTVPGQPCPRAENEWELLPDVRNRLAGIDWTTLRFGVASNQDQVGYGLVTAQMAERLLRDLVSAATDGRVTDPLIRFCPHRLDVPCDCRKPAPGMVLDLMRAANTVPEATLFVGDGVVDQEAAKRASVRFAWARDFFRQPRRPGP